MSETSEKKSGGFVKVATSIYKRTSETTGKVSYLIQFYQGNNRRWETAPTLAAARAKLTEKKRAVQDGTYVPSTRKTLAEWGETWLANLPVGKGAESITQRTLEGYEYLLRVHVFPKAIGRMLLQSISPIDVRQWRTQLGESGRVVKRKDPDASSDLSPRTVLHAYRALYTCLQDAVEDRLLHANPAAGRRRKRAKQAASKDIAEVKALERGQVSAILTAAKGTFMFPIIALALGTGMRRGEILALRWADLDLAGGSIHVHRAVGITRKLGVSINDRTKTDGSKRRIGIRGETVALLEAHRKDQAAISLQLGMGGKGVAPSALVFPCLLPRKKGAQPVDLLKQVRTAGLTVDFERPWSPDAITRTFTRIADQCELPGTTFHHLRHTHASQLLLAKVPVSAVSSRLGHSSATTTMNIYAHVLKQMESHAAEEADGLLGEVLKGM